MTKKPAKDWVLVVDDDNDSIALVTAMVEYLGYTHDRANDYDTALGKLEGAPAALVLDIVMPNADSERLLAHVARQSPQLPVIFMSALEPEAIRARIDAARALGVNVVDGLTKPFWLEPLIAALEKAIPDAEDAR
jgi:two-component system OmpR family response regulator